MSCTDHPRVRGEHQDLLAPAAALSNDATILDRFFLKHLLTSGRGQRDHHAWLLQKLDQSLHPGASVQVLSELPKTDGGPQAPRMSPTDAERKIRAKLAPLLGKGRIRQVRIVLAPWPERWQGGPHNRHIRFSCGVALTTDEGFDYLDRPTLVAPFTWKVVTSPKRIGELTRSESVILNAKTETRVEVILDIRRQPRSTRAVDSPSDQGKARKGQRFKGTVKATQMFGVFVDVGLHRDGLIPERFLKGRVLERGQAVDVEIDGVDAEGKIRLRLVPQRESTSPLPG